MPYVSIKFDICVIVELIQHKAEEVSALSLIYLEIV